MPEYFSQKKWSLQDTTGNKTLFGFNYRGNGSYLLLILFSASFYFMGSFSFFPKNVYYRNKYPLAVPVVF